MHRTNKLLGDGVMSKSKGGKSNDERARIILDVLRAKGSAKVGELEKLLGVSDMTIRRCLNDLAAEGLLKRTHGGATALEPNESEGTFQIRLRQNVDLKARLAAEALRLIDRNVSIYLDAGSTCFAIAKQLSMSGKRCTVITDSILVLQELQGMPNLDSIILGGSLARDKITVDGPLTVENVGRISVDICFFSADGFTCEQMENQYLSGTLTKRMMIQRAGRSVFVCDSSKFEKPCCFRFCGWDEIDTFLTDSHLPKEARDAIAGKAVDVQVFPIPT